MDHLCLSAKNIKDSAGRSDKEFDGGLSGSEFFRATKVGGDNASG